MQDGLFVIRVHRYVHTPLTTLPRRSCEDKTIAGVWRRAEATAANPATFSKIVLSKLLILPTEKARDDYFKQQSTFVTREGNDEYTEFSTSIQGELYTVVRIVHDADSHVFKLLFAVKGFRRRMLAVRPVEGILSAKLFRLHLFWMFTLMGLTVPYRIWFSRHCDELRVTVAKETTNVKTSSSWGWFSRSSSDPSAEWNKEFKSKMRELALYASGENPLPLIQSSNETISEALTPIEEEKTTEIEFVASDEISNNTSNAIDSNATESKSKGNGDDKNEQLETLPPPPHLTKEDDAIGAASKTKGLDESSTNNKEQ